MERLKPTGDEEVARLDAVLESLAGEADPRVTALVAEVVSGLHRLHAGALERLVEILAEEPETFGRALADPVVANLFHLYDLVMVDEAARAREALDRIRPSLRDGGGDARLVEIDDGVAVLELEGACRAIAELRERIDRALAEAVPGYRGFRTPEEGEGTGGATAGVPAAGVASPTGAVSFVPLDNLRELARKASDAARRRGSEGGEVLAAPRRLPVDGAGDLGEGELLGRLVAGEPVLLVRLGGALHAFRNLCPGSLLPLHVGRLEGETLVCPWHGCRFRLPAGEEETDGGRRLAPLPLEEAGGGIRVEVPA